MTLTTFQVDVRYQLQLEQGYIAFLDKNEDLRLTVAKKKQFAGF